MSFELSFHQYCVALSALIQYGSPAQQYECKSLHTGRILILTSAGFPFRSDLHHTYAATSERGIDRSELLQLLKDHSEQVTNIVMKDDKLLHVTDPRHFDKLYTWLKKHFILHDESRSGFLPENLALEMLQTHPTALSHLKFQFAPFVKKVKENNTRYADQAAAARHSD